MRSQTALEWVATGAAVTIVGNILFYTCVCEGFFSESTRSYDIAAYDLVIRTTQLLRQRQDNDNNDSKMKNLKAPMTAASHTYSYVHIYTTYIDYSHNDND